MFPLFICKYYTMDPRQILETIEQLPTSLKNFIYSSMISMTLATKNVNNEIFEVKALPQGDTEQTQATNSLSFLFQNDINNEQVKQYKQRFYKILKEADNIAERDYGQTYFSKNLLNEDNDLFQKMNTKQNQLESTNTISIENKVHLMNPEIVQIGGEPKYDTKIKVTRNVHTDYKIEYLADYLQVKPIRNNYEVRFIIDLKDNKKVNPNDIVKLANFQYVNFYWKYEMHSFKIISYDTYEVKGNQLHILFVGGKMTNFETA